MNEVKGPSRCRGSEVVYHLLLCRGRYMPEVYFRQPQWLCLGDDLYRLVRNGVKSRP